MIRDTEQREASSNAAISAHVTFSSRDTDVSALIFSSERSTSAAS